VTSKQDDGEKPSLALVTDPDSSSVVPVGDRAQVREMERAQRRLEAMSLRSMGHGWEEIGNRLGISREGARQLVMDNLERADNREVDYLRALENVRLDRAQVAIWPEVLAGNLKAVETFLRISQRRAKLNGLDEPTKLDLNVSIRAEMQQALAELENLVLGEVVHSHTETVGDDRATEQG
jgi:ABC-type phosphonate transport system ATPase subunit